MPFFTLLRPGGNELARIAFTTCLYLCDSRSFLSMQIVAVFFHWKLVKANFNNHYMDFLAQKRKKKCEQTTQSGRLEVKCSSPRMSVNMDASSCFILLKSCYFCNFHYSHRLFSVFFEQTRCTFLFSFEFLLRLFSVNIFCITSVKSPSMLPHSVIINGL